MQGKSVEVLLLSFFTVLAKPCNILWLRGYTSSNYNMANNKLWYMIWYILYNIIYNIIYHMYIFQHDRWRCLGQVVGHCCRRRNQVNRPFSRRVKCFCQMLFCTELLWTFSLDFHRQLDLYNCLHILYSISSLGETQQFCGDYIFSGHTGCLILAYLVVSHNLHNILDLKRGKK